jgi:hypothetical protein
MFDAQCSSSIEIFNTKDAPRREEPEHLCRLKVQCSLSIEISNTNNVPGGQYEALVPA